MPCRTWAACSSSPSPGWASTAAGPPSHGAACVTWTPRAPSVSSGPRASWATSPASVTGRGCEPRSAGWRNTPMGILLSPELACDALRARVGEAVRQHWVRPEAAGPLDPPRGAAAEELARTALDTMLTRQFRVGPLPPPEVYEQFLAPVRRYVSKGRPIRVTVGYGPLKNPNAVAHSRADWAEFFALCHLVAWHNKVQRVYPPGLQFQIVFDDETLILANGTDRAEMDAYMSSIGDLIRALGLEGLFL